MSQGYFMEHLFINACWLVSNLVDMGCSVFRNVTLFGHIVTSSVHIEAMAHVEAP